MSRFDPVLLASVDAVLWDLGHPIDGLSSVCRLMSGAYQRADEAFAGCCVVAYAWRLRTHLRNFTALAAARARICP